jgi:hypothetical protein
MLLINKILMYKKEVSTNFFANIRERIQKNNKKTEKITFLMKNSWYCPYFDLKKRYFS